MSGDVPRILMREEIEKEVLKIIKSMMGDVDFGYSGEIGPESRVGVDLDFESVQVVSLFTKIQMQFGNRKIPFQDLVFRRDEIVDFTIRDIVEFLHEHFRSFPPN